MKQLALPMMEDWKFSHFRMEGQRVERAYSNGSQMLRLFLKETGWYDLQNRLWKIVGPSWGQPILEILQ